MRRIGTTPAVGASARTWHDRAVRSDPVRRRLHDALYAEAMLLADESRGYFEDELRREQADLDPLARVQASCEALKVTTRLLHVIAWLLTWRAVDDGEIAVEEARMPSRRLGAAPDMEEGALSLLPARARELTAASIDLHRRAARLDEDVGDARPSPARSMQERLAREI